MRRVLICVARQTKAVAAGALLAGVLIPVAARAQKPAPDGTIYVGTYGKTILVVDEATLTVRDTIHTAIGIPYEMLPSYDKKHFYILDPQTENVEIIDIATRKSRGTFTLSSSTDKSSTRVRIRGMDVDPKERFAVLLVKTFTKKIDRYEIGRPTLLRYDLAKHAVTDTIPWPRGEEREFSGVLFSPNGEFIYFFTTDDILIYDATTLKEVDRWELTRAQNEDAGMGRVNFGFPNDIYEEPGFYTGLFRSTDPVNRRTMMGVARVDLVHKSVDYYQLGPSQGVSFRLAPDKKRAYGLHSEVGNYQFWTFDLENHRVLGKTEFKGRSRMGMTVSSNGEFIYIHTAGNTIDVYDTTNFKLLKTVTFAADMTNLVLIPAHLPGRGN
jgi:DNA-binding beta-propeller fold protein YncE